MFEKNWGQGYIHPSNSSSFWKTRFKISRSLSPSAVISRSDAENVNLQKLWQSGGLAEVQWLDALYVLDNQSMREHGEYIRAFFTPVPRHLDAIADHVAAARQGVEVLVGVHIRQGDYAQHAKGLLYYEVEEFRRLMSTMEAELPDTAVRFLVCSNERQPASVFEGLNWGFGPGTEIGDLYALAACDYIIGPASSYSQWASFFGRVPRYVHNRKYEELYGIPPSKLSLDTFQVHERGYGRFV